jgi:DNA processing protein
MDERDSLISLSLAGVHYSKTLAEIESHFGSFQSVWNASDTCLRDMLHKQHQTIDCISRMISSKSEYRHLVESVKQQYTVLTIFDQEYPEDLRQIFDPPQVLYIKGKLHLGKPLIGIVGARKATVYGKWAAAKFARELAERGIGVVSGLAYGIDAASHQGCLDGDGYTVGVLE